MEHMTMHTSRERQVHWCKGEFLSSVSINIDKYHDSLRSELVA